jgi:hypothetical protein
MQGNKVIITKEDIKQLVREVNKESIEPQLGYISQSIDTFNAIIHGSKRTNTKSLVEQHNEMYTVFCTGKNGFNWGTRFITILTGINSAVLGFLGWMVSQSK